MPQANPDAWLPILRRLLAEAFALHQKGAAGVPLGRAYGAADGFMLALIELGVINPKELGALVADERFRLLGPATRILVDKEADRHEEARPFMHAPEAGDAAGPVTPSGVKGREDAGRAA